MKFYITWTVRWMPHHVCIMSFPTSGSHILPTILNLSILMPSPLGDLLQLVTRTLTLWITHLTIMPYHVKPKVLQLALLSLLCPPVAFFVQEQTVQNAGKAKRTIGLLPSEIIVKSCTLRLHIGDPEGKIIIRTDQYNGDEFQVVYPSAKFYIIKPLDKADIHKSIKYGVWSTSFAGSRKLDSAFKEAQAIAARSSTLCPVFMFFSANGSSSFSGIAEMIGAVDFQKDMDFWYNDKYLGYFPVKWHIIKDVPNSCLGGILLQNNKSVTSSCDIEEIPYDSGTNMLNIFKYTRPERCMFDEFMVHEEDEPRSMNQKMFKLRRGAPHFARSSCSGSTVPHKSSNLMMYRAIRETDDLTDEMLSSQFGQISESVSRVWRLNKQSFHCKHSGR